MSYSHVVRSWPLRCLLLLGLVFSLSQVAESQMMGAMKTTAKTKGESAYSVRTYEVGDLVLDVPDHPYPAPGDPTPSPFHGMGGGMGGMGGMGGGMDGGMMNVEAELASNLVGQISGGGGASSPMRTSESLKITMPDLRIVIVTTIDFTSWSEAGGPAEIQQLGTKFVIRQTEKNHEAIRDLLTQLRKGSGEQRTVAIDARWLLLNSDELDRLMRPSKEGPPQIDRKVLAEYTRRPTSIRCMTNCFTGQLVYVVGGTRRNVVSGYIPVVGSIEKPKAGLVRFASLGEGGMAGNPIREPSVGYQPIIEKPNFGTLLEIRPTLIPGDGAAIVDLHSTITVPGEPTSAVVQDRNPSRVPQVDRIAMERQELATTLRVPLGRPALVGGMTYVTPVAPMPGPAMMGGMGGAGMMGAGVGGGPLGPPPTAGNVETPQLYLILELR